MSRAFFRVALLLLGVTGCTGAPHAQQASDSRIADLVQAGKLRAGIGVVAPHWAIKDQATGELRGVAVEVTRAGGGEKGSGMKARV
jgi:hypothetical protein